MAPSYIVNHARQYKIFELLKITDRKINFERAFLFFMQRLNVDKIVTPVTAKLHSSTIKNDSSIAAIHVDSPKFYSEFKPILYRFLPKLRPDGIIIFQDYFLQWSAH